MPENFLGLPGWLSAWPVVFLLAAWGLMAILFGPVSNRIVRIIAAAVYVAVAVAALVVPAVETLSALGAAFLIVIIWWLSIRPSNDRDWQPDVAIPATADIDGDLVTIHNVRNIEYRSDTDFTLRYYDKTYDLNRLSAVDLITSYWMGPAVAHVFISFVFEDRDYLAVSIELRKKLGDEYSVIKGFFRNYEICYVVADERDVIRLRTNIRKPEEQTYLYRTRIAKEDARNLFAAYLERINHLAEHPRFYNTLVSNCTTNILLHTRGFHTRIPLSWKIMLSGYVAEFVYALGGLDAGMPFEELKRRSLINARAREAGDAEDFSHRIRRGLPLMPGD
ncbi:MAG: DUF4105 domain-containing protein [Acidobacteriota bacterium]|nr:MAG: DUF4105 domain-containing protein [Acidobacteriota bacterium]